MAHENPRYDDLRALYINTTLKSTKQGASHTERLMENSMGIMRKNGAADMHRAHWGYFSRTAQADVHSLYYNAARHKHCTGCFPGGGAG